MPRISVIMPVYNVEEFLAQTIESVLNQSYKDFEFICVDDCSTDESLRILKAYEKKDKRIIVLKNDHNQGAAVTRNRALEIARGEYIALQDSDDLSLQDRFLKQLSYMDSQPEICAIGSAMVVVDEHNRIQKYIKYFEDDILIRCHALFTSPIANPTFFMRASILKLTGGYNSEFVRSQDYELLARILQYGKLANLPDYLVCYRRRGGQLTAINDSQRQTTEYIVKKIFAIYWQSTEHFPHVEIISDMIHASWDTITVEKINQSLQMVWPWICQLIHDRGGTPSNRKVFSFWLLKHTLRFYGYKLRSGYALNFFQVTRTLININWRIVFSVEFLWFCVQSILGRQISTYLFKFLKASNSTRIMKLK